MSQRLRRLDPAALAVLRQDVAKARWLTMGLEVALHHAYGSTFSATGHARKMIRALDRIMAHVGAERVAEPPKLNVPRVLRASRRCAVGRLAKEEHVDLVDHLHTLADLIDPADGLTAAYARRDGVWEYGTLSSRVGVAFGARWCDCALVVMRGLDMVLMLLADQWCQEHGTSEWNPHARLRDLLQRRAVARCMPSRAQETFVPVLRGLDGHAGKITRIAPPTPSWTPILIRGEKV